MTAPGSSAPARETGAVILCEPHRDCADPHLYRWHCMRGHADEDRGIPAKPGVCPLTVCDRRGANRVGISALAARSGAA